MTKVSTARWSGTRDRGAMCRDCDWEAYGANCIGIAQQHAAHHGHRVETWQVIATTYAPSDMTREQVFADPVYGSAYHQDLYGDEEPRRPSIASSRLVAD